MKITNEKDLLKVKNELELYKIPQSIIYKAIGELFKKNDLDKSILESLVNQLKENQDYAYIKDIINGRTIEYCSDESYNLDDLYKKLTDISKLKIHAALYYLSIYKHNKYKTNLVKAKLIDNNTNKLKNPLFTEVFRYMNYEQKRLYINNMKSKKDTRSDLINFLLKVQLSIANDNNKYLQINSKKIEVYNIDKIIAEDEEFKQEYWSIFSEKYLKDKNYQIFYNNYYYI